MAVIIGEIEPLNRLREILNRNGITRFNSIGEINSFLAGYASEMDGVPEKSKESLDREINELKIKLDGYSKKRSKNIFNRAIYYPKVFLLRYSKNKLSKNYSEILTARIYESKKELEFIRCVVESLYEVIAGAIGENQTVKELEKLSDDCFVINDYSLSFNPPIYNRQSGERIFSIQVDHLLICKAGVFIIETKNWSRESVGSLSLRSPVEQVSRASYALFVLLNSESGLSIQHHHWGCVKIPIKNIVAMTKYKPKDEFKYVKVLTLNELIGYIQYFDDVFSSEEVKHIVRYLLEGVSS